MKDFKITPETLGYEIKGGRLVNEAPSPNELANANIDLFSINTRKR